MRSNVSCHFVIFDCRQKVSKYKGIIKNTIEKKKGIINHQTIAIMELEAGSQVNLYQVNFLEEKVGKMMKNSKMKMTWSFRESNDTEHNITLIWSKNTGKQEITMDGTEIWFGRNQGRSVLDHNWKTRDERLKLHVLATCAPKVNENFRNFDLVINGQLFATLPHYGREGSNAPIPPPMGQDNLNSIIQILYPDGYSSPVDKEEEQQQQQRRQEEEGHPQQQQQQQQQQYNIVVDPSHRDSAITTTEATTGSSWALVPDADLLGGNNIVPTPPVQQQQQQQVTSTTIASSDISHQPMLDLLG